MSLSTILALAVVVAAPQDDVPPAPTPVPAPVPAPEPAPAPEEDQAAEIPADGAPPITTASGLTYSVLEPGLEGTPTPTLGDMVEVHYTGYLENGFIFDDSRTARVPGTEPQTSKFRLGRVIPGWNEGLQLMPVGSRFKLTVPAELAYGDQQRGDIPPNSTLIFDVELIGFEPGKRPAPFIAIDPQKAITLARGIRYQMVEPGTGEPPAGSENVKLWFTMFAPDGTPIDCSEWGTGPLQCSIERAPLPFLEELLPVLSEGAVTVVEVPPSVGLGDQRVPGIGEGDPSIWRLEVLHVARAPELPAFEAVGEEGVQTTGTGIRYRVVNPGAGTPPDATQTFKLVFTYWTAEGTLIESSLNTPTGGITANTEQLMLPFMKELPLLMAPGSVWVCDVPADQGFGQRTVPGVAPGASTIWRMELREILNPLPIPEFRRPDPATAVQTESGLTIQTLVAGSGEPPREDQNVVVHYAGWLAKSGEIFDNSFERGEPSTFGVTRVISGWTEALLELPPGSTALLEIPAALAYGSQGAPPAIGPNEDLIFFVQVIDVTD